MSDVLSPEQRSYNMSQIKSKWTKQEKIVHNYLKGMKVRHQMHPNIYGKPDILIKETHTVVFLDGCFWHKCPKCFVEPSSNRDFWLKKIENNVKRDKNINRKLMKTDFKVVRIWEHDIKKKMGELTRLI